MMQNNAFDSVTTRSYISLSSKRNVSSIYLIYLLNVTFISTDITPRLIMQPQATHDLEIMTHYTKLS